MISYIAFRLKFIGIIAFTFFGFRTIGQQKISLVHVLSITGTNNPGVKAYRLNSEIQQKDIITAGLRPNPLFNQQSLFLISPTQIGRIPDGKPMFASPYSRQTWFQITKQFQLDGKRQAKIDFQTKEYEYAKKDVNEYINNITYQAAYKWLDVWYAYLVMSNLVKASNTLDTLQNINKIRFKDLAIAAVEVNRTELLSEQYKILLYQAAQRYKSERQKLAYLLGLGDSVEVDIDSDFFYKDLSDNPDSLYEFALNNRPEILSDKALVSVANASITMRKKLGIPNPEFGFVYNPQNFQPYAGWYFQVPLPLFDRNQGEVQRGKVEYDQSKRQVEATALRIKNEINYSLQEYEVNKDNSERYRDIIESSNHILKTVRYAYLRGGTTIVDYLLAQQNWFDTQKNYYETVYLYRKSYLDLLYVSGILY